MFALTYRLFLASTSLFLFHFATASASELPNIVVIMADDQGWSIERMPEIAR